VWKFGNQNVLRFDHGRHGLERMAIFVKFGSRVVIRLRIVKTGMII